MSFTSGSDDRAESLGVRRPVELPTTDIEDAGELTPGAGVERDDGEVAAAGTDPAESGAVSSGVKETPADTAAEEKTRDKKEGDAGSLAQAVAVTTPPASGDVAGDGMPPDRPKKPVLAAVAIGGAVVLAIPILLIGTGSHHGKKHRTVAAANTVLSGGQQPPAGAYVSTSPSATPTPTPSATPSKKPSPTPSPKSKPKASKSAAPKHAGKAGVAALAHHGGVPASQRPKSGGNPYALEVHSPYVIASGKTLRTNRIALTMQTGGNLVLRDTSGKIIWATGTHKHGVYAEFQTDGNLVVYAGNRQAIWAAGTFGHNAATLVLQADDNMVIYDRSTALWATGTNR